jgi:thiamine pyrophosphate-dependent acetolactate synthase large subunit-like protein
VNRADRTREYYGSDLVVDYLRALGIEFLSINPGATLRGLHDSLLRAGDPLLISTLHEEIAVGIAHGYAKSAGKPMAVAVHDHVGPLHAHMALFNAWADDVPMLVIGGSGPRDTASRRPWIDWIHTSSPTAAPVRDAVKWDCDPASIGAIVPSLSRAYREAIAAPPGPVFVSLDVLLQEEATLEPASLPLPIVPAPPIAAADRIEWLVDMLLDASAPLLVVDRPPRGTMEPLVRLAEFLAAGVVDLGSRSSFPNTHWADQTESRSEALAGADVVVAIDPRDLLWTVTAVDERNRTLETLVRPDCLVVSVGTTATRSTVPVDRGGELTGAHHLVGHAPAMLELAANLAESSSSRWAPSRTERKALLTERWRSARDRNRQAALAAARSTPIHPAHLGLSLSQAVADGPWQLSNGVLGGWLRRLWDFESENSYLGRSGGEGLGYGLPASVGASLAHKGDDTLIVDLQSDGDLLYTPQALWTAAHHGLPLMVVVYDNRAYGRDLVHQRLVAVDRGWEGRDRPDGVVIDDPAVRFDALAESFGVEARGPVEDPSVLQSVLGDAARIVREERRPMLVHVVSS